MEMFSAHAIATHPRHEGGDRLGDKQRHQVELGLPSGERRCKVAMGLTHKGMTEFGVGD